jgi:phosphatidylglycerol lysyltransferase
VRELHVLEIPSNSEKASPQYGRQFKNLHHIAPVLLGVTLFAMGAYALHQLLKSVNLADIIQQTRTIPLVTLVAAFGATALGYVALIGYDWSALRYLGKKLPVRIVAMGGFLGYSFGNTIGISVISGGAVRYRIYSAFGLNAFEVASVSTFVALAFGVGITVIGLGALAYHPYALGAVLPWDPSLTRLISGVSVIVIMGILGWLSATGKTLTIRKVVIAAPSPGILMGQLAFTLVDTAMAALTLYVLLPTGTPDFMTFLAIFATAAMAGVLSHVPGGVGVFESVIIASMPPGAPLEQVAAALLLYRLIYYLVPFALAVVFVALNEARLAGGLMTQLLGEVPEQMRPVLKTATSVAPSITGTAVLGLGAYLLLMALLPTARPDEIDPNDLLAAILFEGGALMSAVLGIVLILLSQGLIRRISGAFWLTEITLLAGAIASLLNGLDVESALLLLFSAAIIWPFKREFYRSAQITQGLLSPGWFALIISIAIGVGTLFFFVHEATPYSNELWTQFSSTSNTPRALRAALLASMVLTFTTIYLALQPARAHSRVANENALELAAQIITSQNDPEAYLALSGDKDLFFADAEDAFIMHARQGRSWIAYSDPVGPESATHDLAWSFFDEAYAANCRPVFYEISEKYLPLWVEMGLTLHKMGEEAVVNLPEFSLAGAKFKKMRAAHNKALKSGMEFAMLSPPHSPKLIAELKAVSNLWLGDKSGREKGFSVGKFSADYLGNFPISVIRHDGKILAFANIMRPNDGPRVSIDLMRYLPDKASGMMEFLFLELMLYYQEQGAQEFSLGMAPLAGLEARRGARLWSRFGALLFRHGGAFYNFEGLRAFKQKFQPDWRPRYMAIPGSTPPLVVIKDVTLLISGSPTNLFRK